MGAETPLTTTRRRTAMSGGTPSRWARSSSPPWHPSRGQQPTSTRTPLNLGCQIGPTAVHLSGPSSAAGVRLRSPNRSQTRSYVLELGQRLPEAERSVAVGGRETCGETKDEGGSLRP